MPEFRVDIPNLAEVKRAFRDWPRISEPIFQRATVASQAVLAKHTTKGAVPWRSGLLCQTFAFEFGRLWAKWYPTRDYAFWVHEGTRPHDIPNAFGWRGVTIHHPGTKPNQFMPRIIAAAREETDKVFMDALDMASREIARRISPDSTS